MAIDSKIIRIRRGTAADFNVGKTKLVQGEFAVVTDTKEAYFAAENGEAVRLATEKDVSQLQEQIGDFEEAEVDGANIIEMINNAGNSGGGISQLVKDALINCFNHVAWIDGNGSSYVQTLQTALNASTTAKVVSISAVYSGGSVASGSSLSALKENLVVTATYDDGTEVVVTGYTLSGSIAEGENEITVTYRKVTTTFVVIGLASYTITYDLTNVASSSDVSAVISGEYYTTTLSHDSSYDLQSVIVTMGGVDITSDVYGDETILITEVTGDVVITAVANEPIINEAILCQSGTSVYFYSTSDTTTLLASKSYGYYGLVPDIATADSIAKITITNNTGETIAKSTSFYAGQTKSYDNTTIASAYDSELVYETSSLGIEDGNSITFTANVKKGYKLIFTAVAGCELEVKNIIVDPSYDTDEYTEYSASIIGVGASTNYYSDDGTTTLATRYYGQHLVTDNVFEEDTEVIITWINTSETNTGGTERYVGSMPVEAKGLSNTYIYYAEKFGTTGNIPVYGYVQEKYTVKAGHYLAVKCGAESDTVEITFKSKAV